jgi:hypothetical protein
MAELASPDEPSIAASGADLGRRKAAGRARVDPKLARAIAGLDTRVMQRDRQICSAWLLRVGVRHEAWWPG